MKIGKSISLFFVFSAISFAVGLTVGVSMDRQVNEQAELENLSENTAQGMSAEASDVIIRDEPVVEVSAQKEKLNADTDYILLERDMDTGEVVETCTRIPEKYIGMNRQQLTESLKEYEANPPLAELERGFVSLELLSFSTGQIEVQMNYQYVKPSKSFYIMVYDNCVKVMLEDRKTVYLDTEIQLSDLPYDMQQEIMLGLYVPDEESLYDFLENYTS